MKFMCDSHAGTSSLYWLPEAKQCVSWYKWTDTWYMSWYISSYTLLVRETKTLDWNKIKWPIIIKSIETGYPIDIMPFYLRKKKCMFCIIFFVDWYNFNTTKTFNLKLSFNKMNQYNTVLCSQSIDTYDIPWTNVEL